MTNTNVSGEQIHPLDPASICDSMLPNRDTSSYSSEGFMELQRNIQGMGYNIDPIKVRRVHSKTPPILYEVIFGHRRLRACRNLGLKVRTLIAHDITDRQVLIERVAENSGREEFTALEFGRICAKLLQGNESDESDGQRSDGQRGVAAALSKNPGLVSKALSLAKLPNPVIAAFQYPADLQYRHAKPLTDALLQDSDAVLLIAAQLAEEPGPRKPADVLERLTSLSLEPVEPFNRNPGKRKLMCRGENVGTLNVNSKGISSVQLTHPLDDAGIEALEKALVLIIGRSSTTKPPKHRDKAKAAP